MYVSMFIILYDSFEDVMCVAVLVEVAMYTLPVLCTHKT